MGSAPGVVGGPGLKTRGAAERGLNPGGVSEEQEREVKHALGLSVPLCRIYALDPGLPLFTSIKRLLYLIMCYNLGLLRRTHIYESGESESRALSSEVAMPASTSR